MNNKGFTLIELLAVMVILLSISVVAVTNVTASLKRSETQEIESQKKTAINAAKIYFSTSTGNQSCVIKADLVSFMNSNNAEFNIDKLGDFSITIGTNNYVYTENGTC